MHCYMILSDESTVMAEGGGLDPTNFENAVAKPLQVHARNTII